jgi:tetratricopeptide (TPR) repeat protein
MRAWQNWLAAGPLLVLVGCTTLYDRAAPAIAPSGLNPEDERMAGALAHYSLALISEVTLGGSQAALMHLRAAAAADPASLPLALKVAADHLKRKEYEAAVTVLRRTLAHHPKSMEAHLILGIACQLNSQNRQAEREFRTAIQLAPLASEPRLRLASLYAAEEQPRKVLAMVDEGLAEPALKEVFVDFCDNMGRLYVLGGEAAVAIPFLERVLSADANRRVSRVLLARAQVAAGQKQAAIRGLLDLAWRYPEDAQVALLLGELFEEEGDEEKAMRYYEQAAKAKPEDTAATLRVASLRLKTQPEGALALMEEIVRTHPDDVAARIYLGLVYSRLERFAEATAQYARVEALAKRGDGESRPLPSHFYFWYGSACERAGNFEEAERLLQRCLELDPESGQALNYLAYMWADKGIQLEKALTYVTRALKVVPDEGAYLDTLGWVYYRQGEYGKALKCLRKAARAMPDDPVIHDHLGDALYALGEPGEARRYWQKSLELEPGRLSLPRREER